LYNSAISAGGLAAAHISEAIFLAEIEAIAGFLATPVVAIALAPIAMYTRGILKRVADRRHFARRIYSGNQKLEQLVLSFS
jgi:hypothetical protein